MNRTLLIPPPEIIEVNLWHTGGSYALTIKKYDYYNIPYIVTLTQCSS